MGCQSWLVELRYVDVRIPGPPNEGVEAKEEDPQEETKQKKEDMYDQIL